MSTLPKLAIVGLTFFALAGCSDSTQPEADTAPELPPVQSLSIDLGFFRDNRAVGLSETAQAARLNFINALVRVDFLNVAVLTALAPPSAVFALAIHSVPTRDDDGAYLWIYTWREGGQDHQIRLRGLPVETRVEWELAIARAGVPAEVWFHGESHTDRDEGFWVFRDFEEAGDPEVFRIEWEVDEATARLDLINQDANDPDVGDELRYSVNGSLGMVEFQDESDGMTWDIQWDEADGSGSLMVPDYRNGERSCWDGEQEDVSCAAAAAE